MEKKNVYLTDFSDVKKSVLTQCFEPKKKKKEKILL